MSFENLYYILLDIACLAGPLALSFDKKVRFNTYFGPTLKSLLIVGLFFLLWDLYFTYLGVWGFNPRFLLGLNIINLPIEEVLFFLAIPFAFLFTYECIKVYFNYRFNKWLVKLIILFFLSWTIQIGTFHYYDIYTASVGTFVSVSLIYFLIKTPEWFSNFLVSYWVILIPFFFVNGLLTGMFTDEPIVWYNNLETQGVRIVTIPLEDFLYAFGLLLWNTWFFERFRGINRIEKQLT